MKNPLDKGKRVEKRKNNTGSGRFSSTKGFIPNQPSILQAFNRAFQNAESSSSSNLASPINIGEEANSNNEENNCEVC